MTTVTAELMSPGETRRSWMVLIACSVASAFSLLGLLFAVLPPLTTIIEAETGWSRTAITGAMAVTVAVSALASPWFGTLVDRYGPRRVILASQAALTAGFVGIGLVGDNLLLYYAAFAAGAFVSTGLTLTSYMKVIAQWFDRRRGLAMGVSALGGAGLGIVLPVVAAWVGQTYGWRANFLGLAAASLLIALPMQYFFIHERPGSQPPPGSAHRRQGFFQTLAEASRAQPVLKWMIVTFFVMGLGQTTVLFAMAPMLVDRGMTPVEAASVQSLVGVATIFGKLLGGWMYDRFRSPRPLLLGLSGAGIGAIGLGLGATGPAAFGFALLLGLAAGIETDGPPYMVSRYFSLENFGKITASITTIAVLALACGPVLGSMLRDLTGSYLATCLGAGGLLFLAAALTMRLPPFPETGARLDGAAAA